MQTFPCISKKWEKKYKILSNRVSEWGVNYSREKKNTVPLVITRKNKNYTPLVPWFLYSQNDQFWLLYLSKMETSTLSLLEDAEDLMVDTRKRIVSSNDACTSFEIVREDLTLAMKNLNEFRKIYLNHYRMP